MNNYNNTQFIHLSNKNLETILIKYNLASVLIVHGSKSYKLTGAERLFSEVFTDLNIEPSFFSDFTENPNWVDIQQGVSYCKKIEPTLILGIGGGSAMDVAKLIRFFYSNTGTPAAFSKNSDLVPLILFPTTAGTGSETTHFAVCYMDGLKYSIADESILPTEAYIDYRFTLTASPYLTACSGFDALSQAIESYWSIKSTKDSRAYVAEAIKLIYPNLEKCVFMPSEFEREQLAIGSNFSGRAINISFTTAPHAYSYGITTYMNLPHGHAVACTLPYFFELNMNVSDENCMDSRGVDFVRRRMDELCLSLGITLKDCFLSLIRYINLLFMNKKIVPPSVDIIREILKSVNVERLGNNPVKILQPPPIGELFDFYG